MQIIFLVEMKEKCDVRATAGTGGEVMIENTSNAIRSYLTWVSVWMEAHMDLRSGE